MTCIQARIRSLGPMRDARRGVVIVGCDLGPASAPGPDASPTVTLRVRSASRVRRHAARCVPRTNRQKPTASAAFIATKWSAARASRPRRPSAAREPDQAAFYALALSGLARRARAPTGGSRAARSTSSR